MDEIFISGTEPTAHDNWRWLIPIDTRNGLLAGSECPEEVVTYRPYTRYPAEAQDWARSNNIPQPPDVYSPWCMAGEIASVSQHSTDAHRASTTDASARAMVMTSPDSGSQYRLSPQIPETAQQIFVAVRPVDGIVLQEVTLFADGRLLATLDRPPYQVLWQMTSGAHTFTATGIDAHGRRLTADHIDIVVIE